MLIVYSPEVNFMPHYTEKSDSWHLFYWTITFYTILFLVAFLNLFFMIKNKEIIWETVIIIGLSLLFFGVLNYRKSNFPEIGYIGLLTILIYFSVSIFKNKKEKIH